MHAALPRLTLSAIASLLPGQSQIDRWSDGKAELDGYQLVQPRYGELRKGTVVLIFVKEDFSEALRVKADPGRHEASDVFPVLKLNAVKDFQTGIYDYNLMTSVFSAFESRKGRREGAPTKIVFSAQEWCGSMFEELLFDAKSVRQRRFSYFDGEADQEASLEHPEGGVTVDELPILVRGITEAGFHRGETKEVAVLPSLERMRLIHKKLEWRKGRITRGRDAKRVSTGLGEVEIETWTIDVGDGDRYEYDVELKDWRRIIAWRGPDKESGRILGSQRLKYWEMHAEGDERALKTLGLRVPTE
jgi:hypothetical protein